MTDIKLSVCCLAYNHEKFIRQALDGFVMQKTNFPFEVIVHDDASTDKTADIIREYAKKYPDIIKPIYQKENQYSQGKGISKNFIYPRIQGKYVALCEGDDYWTDENKLQKQVDFLDAHPDVSVCFHPVKVIWEDGSHPEKIFPKAKSLKHKRFFTIDDLLKRNFIQTNSVVYRWRLKGHEDLIPRGIMPGDWFLHLLHAEVGKIAILPDVMAVYRRNQGGVWTGAGVSDAWFKKCGLPHLAFFKEIEKRFGCDKSDKIRSLLTKAMISYLRCGEWSLLQQLAEKYPDVYQSVLSDKSELFSLTNYQQKYQRMKIIALTFASMLVLCVLYLIFR